LLILVVFTMVTTQKKGTANGLLWQKEKRTKQP